MDLHTANLLLSADAQWLNALAEANRRPGTQDYYFEWYSTKDVKGDPSIALVFNIWLDPVTSDLSGHWVENYYQCRVLVAPDAPRLLVLELARNLNKELVEPPT